MKDLSIVVFVLIVLVTVMYFGFNIWNRSQLRTSCAVFSKESGRETKFVDYTYWQRDCLTPQDNGKWISVFNLRGK